MINIHNEDDVNWVLQELENSDFDVDGDDEDNDETWQPEANPTLDTDSEESDNRCSIWRLLPLAGIHWPHNPKSL